MPEGIIGQSDDIEVLSSLYIGIKPFSAAGIVAAAVQMKHYSAVRGYLSHRTDARADESCNIVNVVPFSMGPHQAIGDLISHLYHLRKQVETL